MSRKHNDETGRFATQYPKETFIETLDESESLMTTQEVANEVGCSYDLAYRKLKELNEEKKIKRQKMGKTFAWFTDRD